MDKQLRNINNFLEVKTIPLTKKEILWMHSEYPKLKIDNNIVKGKVQFDRFYFDQLTEKRIYIKDEYFLEIDLNLKQNSMLPTVKETKGIMKKISEELKMKLIDLHINEKDQSFCMVIYQKEKDFFPDGVFSLKIFFKKILEPFLYWISFYKKNKRAPWRGFSHDFWGQFEYFVKENHSFKKIEKHIPEIITKNKLKKMKGHHKCICSSGQNIRNCHKLLIEVAKKLNNEQLFKNKK